MSIPSKYCSASLHRSQMLQKAKLSYSNYRSGYNNLNQFLCNVPNYEPQETDNVSQVETKLKNQQVIIEENRKSWKELQSSSSFLVRFPCTL